MDSFTLLGFPFSRVNLDLIKTGIENIFQYKVDKTVKETLQCTRYKNLEQYTLINFSSYLNKPLGEFILYLKSRGNVFYKEFLNPYGDEKYSKFIIREHLSEKGLYIFMCSNSVAYIGKTTDSFGKRINVGYGNISPKNCYKDGQATNCHLNSLITKNWGNISFFINLQSKDIEISINERKLIEKYKPSWNVIV